MSIYGLRTFDNNGNLNFDSSVDRLNRIIGTYSYNLSSGQSVTIPIPSFIDDGTWTSICCATDAVGIVPSYARNSGYIYLYNFLANVYMQGFVLVIRN